MNVVPVRVHARRSIQGGVVVSTQFLVACFYGVFSTAGAVVGGSVGWLVSWLVVFVFWPESTSVLMEEGVQRLSDRLLKRLRVPPPFKGTSCSLTFSTAD